MTGFGRGTGEAGGQVWAAEVRAVNHRHLDVAVRLPREQAALEPRLRAQVRARLARGRVELAVTAPPETPAGRGVRVDTGLAALYHKALQDLADHLHIPCEVDARFFAGLPGVLTVQDRPVDAEADWPPIEAAVAAALDALLGMRAQEGAALALTLQRALATVAACLEGAEGRAPVAAADHAARVRARVTAAAGGVAPGELTFDLVASLLRSDIAEELARLRSHLAQATAALSAPGPVGRTLDFLAQEMQREWGTIAAKASDREIADLAVVARVAVEQVREQVQNIE